MIEKQTIGVSDAIPFDLACLPQSAGALQPASQAAKTCLRVTAACQPDISLLCQPAVSLIASACFQAESQSVSFASLF